MQDTELSFCSLNFFLILLQVDPPDNIYDFLLKLAVVFFNLAITYEAALIASLSHVSLPVDLVEEEYLFEEHGPLLQRRQGMVEVYAVVLKQGFRVSDWITVLLVLFLEPAVFVIAHGLNGPANFQVKSAHRACLFLVSLSQFLLVQQY